MVSNLSVPKYSFILLETRRFVCTSTGTVSRMKCGLLSIIRQRALDEMLHILCFSKVPVFIYSLWIDRFICHSRRKVYNA